MADDRMELAKLIAWLESDELKWANASGIARMLRKPETAALLSAPATPSEELVATHTELIRVYRHKAGGPARIVATAKSWSGLGPGTDYEMVHEQTISWSEANAPALSASATSRPVSPARPPQVAELAAKARSVADGLIRIDGDRDWDTRSDISVETVTQEIVPLLRSLATALAAQGDGE